MAVGDQPPLAGDRVVVVVEEEDDMERAVAERGKTQQGYSRHARTVSVWSTISF